MTGNIKKIIWSMVIGGGVTLFFLIVKNQCAWKFLKSANYGLPMLIEQSKIENLFIGSSTFRQGLDIKIIEKSLGEDSYVLSYDGNQPVMEYFELKYLYDHGVEINNLYVDFYPYTAAENFKISDSKIFLETDIKFKKEITEVMIKEKRKFQEIIEMYVSANNELLLWWPISYPLVNNRFYKGGSVVEQNMLSQEILDDLKVPERNELDAMQVEYLVKLVRLAKENGTEVSFVEIPKYQTLMENRKYQDLSAKMKDLLKKEGVYCIMVKDNEKISNQIFFPTDYVKYYMDLVHLSSEGRRRFTEMLMDRIR